MSTKKSNSAVGEDAVAVDAPAADEARPLYRIAGLGLHGFHRAGRHWPREGAEVAREDFTDEQWAALEGEPMISIKAL